MSAPHHQVIESKVDVISLEIGMHVVRLDRPWEETNFLLQGFVIQDQADIDSLRAQCEFVFIEGRIAGEEYPKYKASGNRKLSRLLDLFRKKQTPDAPSEPAPRRRVKYINKVNTGQEMESAVMSFEEAQLTAKSIMSGLRMGRTLDLNNARMVVNDCVDSVLRNESALLLLTKIKHQDEYTAEHCINVAILAASFAKHLGLLEGEIRNLALCGLLHDVGKTRIPLNILNKPGSLTAEEFEVMKQHTTHGRTILMGTKNFLNTAVDVAFSHHERLDGSGYPRGLNAQQIPYFAKIIALVDAYDAITSNRAYGRGRASMQALDIIHRHRGTQFDEELSDAFIQMIGIYPPGSIVEMVSGEVAIVVQSYPKQKLRPKVLLVLNADKTPTGSSRLLDLRFQSDDETHIDLQISKEVPDGTYGIVLQDYVDEGLIAAAPDTDDSDDDWELPKF